MSRLADATICPDCRAPLTGATCTGCGLRLGGPLGQRLWETMLSADRLVEQLRTLPEPATPATTAPVAPHPGPAAPAHPGSSWTPRPRARLLPAVSVPAVLLSLGALCLLVAAVVFVAIAWGALGLSGRTVVLLAVTALLTAVAVALTRRGLRGAAETFWLIVTAMLTLDLTAGRAAGLAGLDRLSWSGTGLLVGSVLLAVGTGVALWSRRTPTARLVGLEVVAVVGAVLATVSGVQLPGDLTVGSALAVAVAGALAALVLPRLTSVGLALVALAGLAWSALVLDGLFRAVDVTSPGAWWGDLRGWPLAVAAAYAVIASLARRLPVGARASLVALALACLAVLANAPLTTDAPTRGLLTRAATLVVLAAVAAHAPRVWAYAASAVGVLGALTVALPLVAAPLLGAGDGVAQPAAWTWVVAGLALAALAAAAPRVAPPRASSVTRELALQTVTAAASLGVAAAVTTTAGMPRWAGVATCLLAALTCAACAWIRRASMPAAAAGAVAAGYLALVMLDVAAPSSLLVAASTTVLGLTLVVGFARGQQLDDEVSPAVTSALAGISGTIAVAGWASVAGLDDRAIALVVAAYAGTLALLARPVSRRETTRWSWEAIALVAAVAAVLLAPDVASVAWVLTTLGTLVAVLAVTYADRALVGAATPAVLLVATLLGLDTTSVPETVLWVLPAATLLVAGGLLRDRVSLAARVGAGLGTAYVALASLATGGLPDLWSTVLAAGIAVATAALYAQLERRRTAWVAPAAGLVAAWAGAVAIMGAADLIGAAATTRPLVLATYAALLGLVAAPASRTTLSRLALESAAVPVALVAVATCPDRPTLAAVLTLVGTGVALLSVLHRDRQLLGWVGVALLGAATVVRVLGQVQAPELYTLPAAALLLAAGIRRLHGDRDADSLRCLGSGLTLALAPSLLLTLDDPVSLRGALLAAGAVAALAYGVRARLAAPFGAGAITIAVLALRHLGPISDALPRWVALGGLGLALLAVGISWEQRLRDLRSARRYLLALR